jgi:hypothetical protein
MVPAVKSITVDHSSLRLDAATWLVLSLNVGVSLIEATKSPDITAEDRMQSVKRRQSEQLYVLPPLSAFCAVFMASADEQLARALQEQELRRIMSAGAADGGNQVAGPSVGPSSAPVSSSVGPGGEAAAEGAFTGVYQCFTLISYVLVHVSMVPVQT